MLPRSICFVYLFLVVKDSVSDMKCPGIDKYGKIPEKNTLQLINNMQFFIIVKSIYYTRIPAC